MTKKEFELADYLKRKYYINSLGLKFRDLAKIHNRSESAIIQALQGKIPPLLKKITDAKYMGLK